MTRWLALIVFATAAQAAEPTRLLLAIGSNVGAGDDTPLRYANVDATRFRDVMIELGSVKPSRAYLLENATADEVRAALREIKGRAAELGAAGSEVTLFLYVSSHAKAGALRLNDSTLPLDELRALAAAITAPLRVLILDTCESGAAARAKGGRLVSGYSVELERLPLHGEVLISSSGPEEASEEWDALGGSLFTHHLLTGLRGDADAEADGRVTLNEAYTYTYRRTVSASARGAQHPMADIDVSGSGELTLTEPLRTGSAVLLPAASEGRYVIASQPRPTVLLEVDKKAGRELRLAVPSGRYLVRKRLNEAVGLLEIDLPYGGQATVDDAQLVKRSYAEVAIKGGSVELRANALFVMGIVSSPPVAGTPASGRVGLAYRHTFGEWWVGASVSGGLSGYDGVQLRISERTVLSEISGGYRYLRWPVVPYVGLGLRWWLVDQSFIRENEAQLQRVFGVSALPNRTANGLGPSLTLGVEIPLPWRLTALLQGAAQVIELAVERDGQAAPGSPWSVGLNAAVLVGARF